MLCMCFQQCNTSSYSFPENTTVYVGCELAQVQRVRIVAEKRLHLCEARVFATNAGKGSTLILM